MEKFWNREVSKPKRHTLIRDLRIEIFKTDLTWPIRGLALHHYFCGVIKEAVQDLPSSQLRKLNSSQLQQERFSKLISLNINWRIGVARIGQESDDTNNFAVSSHQGSCSSRSSQFPAKEAQLVTDPRREIFPSTHTADLVTDHSENWLCTVLKPGGFQYNKGNNQTNSAFLNV